MSELNNRPSYLTDIYELKGPNRMFITGDANSAYSAVAARSEIMNAAGAISKWWPTLDGDLSFLAQKYRINSEAKRVRKEHPSKLLTGMSDEYKELLVVADKPISTELSYLIGQATVKNEGVNGVCFLGEPKHLGSLALLEDRDEIAILDDPLQVFRWEEPSGAFQRVNAGGTR